ncbi:hypothetical protein SPRG_14062 [Saprolegnia parasitica CBS 223.65]|uniref:Cell wall-active antibiotics response LiaF-like C-terminal domain-containing protein n=1 Tax=Saprolegnia parasitica (strain CBS 223.65) TaxID=695850 RepID=A0A067BR15_SAPPC|nr:hypothetical protein SPRG_14062 [Saprolegnia parasitica CBS 223.65]KDO20969.1 hypothetical protein SPRG_14062 [Saprolegnia parasitica CBS 223.65]|eukprot:XP_012208359.1 hypothetical protein SPRG_14062 [Saprolegnia parasitica CBS 223.65]
MTKPHARYMMGDSSAVLTRQQSHVSARSIHVLHTGAKTPTTSPFFVPATLVIVAILRGETIDLSHATFVYPTTTIKVYAILGGVRIVLPRGVRFESSGVGVAGSFKSVAQGDSLSTEAPLVQIRGVSILGKTAHSVNHNAPPVAMMYSFEKATHATHHPSLRAAARA